MNLLVEGISDTKAQKTNYLNKRKPLSMLLKEKEIVFLLLASWFMILNFNCIAYSQSTNSQSMHNKTSGRNGDGWTEYTDKNKDFSMIYPNGWEIINNENQQQNSSITIFRSPKESSDDIFQDNIVISIIKISNSGNKTADKDINRQIISEKLKLQNNDFVLVNVTSSRIGQNQSGESITYSFNNLSIDFMAKQVVSIMEDRIYIFSLLTEQQAFEKYIQIFNTVLDNFLIIKN
jgi:hypothetical protein